MWANLLSELGQVTALFGVRFSQILGHGRTGRPWPFQVVFFGSEPEPRPPAVRGFEQKDEDVLGKGVC